MTELEFEHISILSLEPKTEGIKELVKKEYGLEGLKVLNSMYRQDELQDELDFLKSLEGKTKEEKHILKERRKNEKLKQLRSLDDTRQNI